MVTLFRALHENKIHDFTNHEQLENFLRRRPHLFQFPVAKPKQNLGLVITTTTNIENKSATIETSSSNDSEIFPTDFINSVIKFMENNCNSANNSGRITLDDNRKAIMFKTIWLYNEIGLQMWKSCYEMIRDMKSSKKFVISEEFCHLADVLIQNEVPDRVTRAIVEALFDRNECDSLSNIFECLYPNIKKYLKSPEGLKYFVEFYPELFLVIEDFVQLKEVPDVQIEKNTDDFNVASSDLTEDMLIIFLNKKLTELLHETENSRIMVIDNQDRPFYKVNYIWELIPPEMKDKLQLKSPNDLMKILENYLHMFKITTYPLSFQTRSKLSESVPSEKIVFTYPLSIQTRSKLSESFPSEKIVSLEILRVKRRMPKAPSLNIFLNLSPICRKRIRDPTELSKFLELHNDFHFNWMNVKDDPTINASTTKNISVDLHGLEISARKSINSELDSLKAQLNDLKSFLNETPFRRKTRGTIKEECSVRFKTILKDIEMLQSSLKTSQVVDEVKDEAFEETFNYLAPPNEAIEEQDIIEI